MKKDYILQLPEPEVIALANTWPAQEWKLDNTLEIRPSTGNIIHKINPVPRNHNAIKQQTNPNQQTRYRDYQANNRFPVPQILFRLANWVAGS